MKSIFSVCVLFISLLGIQMFFSTGALAAMSVTVPSSSNNGEFTIQANNLAGVGGITIKLVYDISTLSIPLDNTESSLKILPGTLITNQFYESNTQDAGVVRLTAATLTGFSGTGSLFTVKFNLVGDSPGRIRAMQVEMIDVSTKPIYFETRFFENAITIKDKLTGSTTSTNSQDVSLVISDAFPDSSEIQISESLVVSDAWEPFVASKDFHLSGGNGVRTVYGWFKDIEGNVSSRFSGSILLDTAAPTGTFKLNGGALYSTKTAVTANLAFTDVGGSGIDKIQFSFDGNTWGELQSYAATKSLTLPNGDGLKTVYVKVFDKAGNSFEKSASITLDTSPPSAGTVLIKGTEPTDSYTNKVSVILKIGAASDASPVTAYCVSNSSILCTTWTAISATAVYPISRSWTLAAGANGERTVYIKFRDKNGISSPPVSDTIDLDTTSPVNGVLAITQLPKDELIPSPNNRLKLDWSGTSDALSGVKEYRLYHGATAIPACSGTPLYSGNLMTYTHTGLAEGSMHYYRLCTYDTAGNKSLGATKSAKAIPELGPPTGGGILIKGTELTDTYTNKTTVTLSISAATDASPVTAYCVSNSATCPAWTAISATALYPIKRSWILASGVDSTRTVNFWYRDKWGNVSEMFSDTINLDKTLPVNGILTVNPGSLKNSLTWSGFSDAFSGVAGYRLMRGITAPTTCATGTPIASLAADKGTYEDTTGLKAGTLYYYRLCAVDNAGNISTGVVKSGKPSP